MTDTNPAQADCTTCRTPSACSTYNECLAAPTPATGAAAELPVVGYAIRKSDHFVWADTRKGRPFAKVWRAVVYADDAQSQLDALHEEVARLKLQALSDNGQWIEEVARLTKERDATFAMSRCECSADEACANIAKLQAELAALKAQPTDVDALMALADEYAEAAQRGEDARSIARHCSALRTALSARKEEL